MAAQVDRQERTTRKSRQAFRTISEVSAELDLPQHVLRFWETKFSQVRPLKRGGNRRYYRPEDIEILRAIKKLLHQDGFTIKGVQKQFREHGQKATVKAALEGVTPLTPPPEGDEAQAKAAEAGTESTAAQSRALESILSELKSIKRLLDES